MLVRTRIRLYWRKKQVDLGVTKGLLGFSGLGVLWGLLRLWGYQGHRGLSWPETRHTACRGVGPLQCLPLASLRLSGNTPGGGPGAVSAGEDPS